MRQGIRLVFILVAMMSAGFALAFMSTGFFTITLIYAALAGLTFVGKKKAVKPLNYYKLHHYGDEFFLEDANGMMIASCRTEVAAMCKTGQITNRHQEVYQVKNQTK